MGKKYFCSQNQINKVYMSVKGQKFCTEFNVMYPNETYCKEKMT
jgi:hypothetical protein